MAHLDKRTNTKKFILKHLEDSRGGLTVEELVSKRYKNSHQPEKKAKTYTIYLTQLIKEGCVIKVGNIYYDSTNCPRENEVCTISPRASGLQ